MKVYTKTGDAGETALFGGKRVSKSSIRIEAYGTVDELNSYIGMVRDQPGSEEQADLLIEVQDRLFTIGALLAADPDKPQLKKPDLYESDIERLEKAIDALDEQLPPLTSFVLPGGHVAVSFCHITRTVCRRAERGVVNMQEAGEEVMPLVLRYLNRLSDYLFVLSRAISQKLNAEETPWIPRK